MLRWLVPYRRLTYGCALSPDEAVAALRERVSTPQGFFGDFGAWYGTIEDRGFRFRRTITYRNSFLPIVSGTIEPTASGSRIEVTMRMRWYTTAFLIVWLSFALYMLVTDAMQAGLADGLANSAVFLAFGGLLPGPAFSFEAAKAERLLEELFSEA